MGTVPHRQTVGEVIIIYEDREGGEVSGGHVILVGILVGILAAHYLFPASTSGGGGTQTRSVCRARASCKQACGRKRRGQPSGIHHEVSIIVHWRSNKEGTSS